jgi:hypothetical protein
MQAPPDPNATKLGASKLYLFVRPHLAWAMGFSLVINLALADALAVHAAGLRPRAR